ncbi:MAG: hypothetical protein CVU94_09135, partial [Firmicutes bacterium HGW-Firmicutes-19]
KLCYNLTVKNETSYKEVKATMNDDPGDADRARKTDNAFFFTVNSEYHINNKHQRMNLGHRLPFFSFTQRQGKH